MPSLNQGEQITEIGNAKNCERRELGLPEEGGAADRDQHAPVRCRLDCQFGPQPANRKFDRQRSAIRRSSLSMPNAKPTFASSGAA